MNKILVILVLAALISVSLAGSIQVIPHAQTSDGTAPIIQVARAETETSVEDSQSLKNAFFTGISWSLKNPEDVEKYSGMADDLDAKWMKTYDGTNWLTGAWHVFLAKMGWKTSKNGLGTTGNYDTVTSFSGGTRTAVTLLKQGKITANTLCLISPQVISAKELKSLIEKGRVKKIVVYQSDSDIFTSSHFKSREGIEVRDFSGIKHGDWIDFVRDQIEDENISPELEIINPPESLLTPEVSPKVTVTVKPTYTPTVKPTPHVSEEKVKDIYEFLEGAERVQKSHQGSKRRIVSSVCRAPNCVNVISVS